VLELTASDAELPEACGWGQFVTTIERPLVTAIYCHDVRSRCSTGRSFARPRRRHVWVPDVSLLLGAGDAKLFAVVCAYG
jgi:hypothetical protein